MKHHEWHFLVGADFGHNKNGYDVCHDWNSSMKDLIEACRKNLGPPPRVLNESQINSLRLRVRGNVETAMRDVDDPILVNLDDQAKLHERGQVVWAHIVQANDALFDPNNTWALPANIVFSMEPFFDDKPKLLGELATGLFAQKGQKSVDPALAEFVHAITDEKIRILNRELPRGYCHGHSVYFTTFFVEPFHLPGRFLAHSFFPVLANPGLTKAVILLPSSFWPKEMVQKWHPLKRKPKPKRPKVVPADPADTVESGVPDDMPAPFKPGFREWLLGPSAKRKPAEAQWARLVALNPDNEELLIAFADWLTECGEPQGELIRLEVKKSKYKEDDPRFQDLDGQWLGVFMYNDKRWFRPLREMQLDPYFFGKFFPYGSMERGLVNRVIVDRPGVLPQQTDRLFAAVPALQRLEIHAVSSRPGASEEMWEPDLGRMLWSPRMRQILELSFNMVMSEDNLEVLGEIPYLAQLRALYMGSSSLGLECALHLARTRYLKNLRILGMPNLDVAEEGIRALVGAGLLAQLTYFDLLGGQIGPGGAAALFAPGMLGPLTTLRLGSNRILDAGAVLIARCPALKNLNELSLSTNRLTAIGIAALASSPTLANVTSLSLDSNDLGSDCLELLARSPHLARLKVLNLQVNAFGDAGVEALARSTTMRHLTELALQYNQIGDAGVISLAGSAICKRLTRLELGNNQIGPDGAIALAASSHLKKLKELDLRDCPIGPEGAKALAKSKAFGELTRLNVSEARIGAKGMDRLRDRFGEVVWE